MKAQDRTPQIVRARRAAFGPEEPGVDPALLARLAARADQGGLLDVAWCSCESPFGTLLLAASRRGLVRVAFEREGHAAVLAQLAAEVGPRVLRAPRRLDAAARQLDEYFAGRRRRFELPLDLRLAHGFRRRVLAQLRRIDYGATASYAGIAKAAGSPAAVRAVGSACAHNPLPLVVPCHRVVRSDGEVGGYRGGSEAKRALLALEAAQA